MLPLLIKKLNEATNGAFDYLKLTETVVYVKSKKIEIHLIYPEEKRKEVLESEKRILFAVRQVLDSAATVEVILTMSHFDLDFFKNECVEFFRSYPSISPLIDPSKLTDQRNEDGSHTVTLFLPATAYEYVKEKQIDRKLDDYLFNAYCEEICFRFEPQTVACDTDEIDAYQEESLDGGLILQSPEIGRYITPENVEEFIGKIVYDKAQYVEDCKKEGPLVVCGTIRDWQELRRKPKEGEAEGKPFFKFTLTDFTDSIKCLIFPRAGMAEKIAMLQNGKQVVIRGDAKQNSFRGETTYDVFVRDLSLCSLPKDFVENRYVRTVDSEYHVVFPQPYVETEQVNLFVEHKEPHAYLQNKTFVVFDLETTGVERLQDTIIEIAGLKIVNGVFKETFSTFVNPRRPIPEKITSLTSITDADVENAPVIEEILPDFQKFTDGAILVGHNIAEFDVPFLNAVSRNQHIEFNHECVDTLRLAYKHLKGLRNKKLKNLVEYYGLTNEHAHRAIYDVIANAKVFLRMCEEFDF